MSWEVILLDEVDHWYCALDQETTGAVSGAIDLLEQEGPTLGRPTVDKVSGSKFHNMKELRPAGTSIRILFIFDPNRQAIRKRSSCSAATSRATGKAGTTRIFRSPRSVTKTG